MSEESRKLFVKPMSEGYARKYLVGVAQRANLPTEHLLKGIEAMAEIIEKDDVFFFRSMDAAISDRIRNHRTKKCGETLNVQECFE